MFTGQKFLIATILLSRVYDYQMKQNQNHMAGWFGSFKQSLPVLDRLLEQWRRAGQFCRG